MNRRQKDLRGGMGWGSGVWGCRRDLWLRTRETYVDILYILGIYLL